MGMMKRRAMLTRIRGEILECASLKWSLLDSSNNKIMLKGELFSFEQ